MSAATPSTANSTSSTSKSRTQADERPQADDARRPSPEGIESSGEATLTQEPPARSRFAWCVTGSGHFLEESIALATRLPALDLFLSDAAEEVLPLYKLRLDELKPRFGPGFRL